MKMKHLLPNLRGKDNAVKLYLYRVLTVSTVLLFSYTAKAIESIGDISKNDFNLIMNQWKFECSDKEFLQHKPDVVNYINQLIPDIIWKGLREVALQNPEFVAGIFKNIKNNKSVVVVSCSYSKEAVGEMVTTNLIPIFKIGKFTFGIPTEEKQELKVGNPIAECLLSDRIKSAARDQTRLQKYVNPDKEVSSYEVRASELIKESCHQTIFHEFLHLAGADNKPVSEHNRKPRMGDMGAEVQKLDDVVYACTRTAFRYGSASAIDMDYFRESHFPPSMTRNTWVMSCRTCTTAEFQNSAVGRNEDPLADDRARISCNRLYDQIPQIRAPEKKSEPLENDAAAVVQ